MESRFFVLFLTTTLAVACLSGCGRQRVIETGDTRSPPIIEPEVETRSVRAPNIDTENLEFGIFAGQLSIEDFGVNTVTGATFAYHITEDFFLELAGGQADAGLTSFERLSGAAQLLTDSDRSYKYYDLSIGYNLLPGETFIGRNRALNMSLYVLGGVGKTDFAGDGRFTVSLGFGMRLMPLDWLAIRADVSDHVFDMNLLGEEKAAHNLAARVGVTFFF